MRKSHCFVGFLVITGFVFAQHSHESGRCDCPSCSDKKGAVFTLPGLKGLNPEGTCDGTHDHSVHSQPADSCGEVHGQHSHGSALPVAAAHEASEQEAACGGHHDCDSHGEGGLGVSLDAAEKAGVLLKTAGGGPVSSSVVFPAEIRLNRDRAAAVSPRYPGVIRQVFAQPGDRVKKGDILASVENSETLTVYGVPSPLDGVVVAKDASAGESAAEGRVLFEVADLSSVWVDIAIFPKYQHRVQHGVAVELIAPDGHTAAGTVQYISPLISHQTRTFTARCVIPNVAGDFTPGAFVRARIVTGTVEVPVRVERGAVQTVKGQTVVFILDEDGFESRDVVTGEAGDQFVEIKEGLSAGERYVAEGSFVLKAEMITRGMDPHAGHGH